MSGDDSDLVTLIERVQSNCAERVAARERAHTPNLDKWHESERSRWGSRLSALARRCSHVEHKIRGPHWRPVARTNSVGTRAAYQCIECGRFIQFARKSEFRVSELPPFDTKFQDRKLLEFINSPERFHSDTKARKSAWFADHTLYLKSTEWRALRLKVLARDLDKCVDCGSAAEHVHHLTYDRWQSESPDDLISLCRKCHETRHGLSSV